MSWEKRKKMRLHEYQANRLFAEEGIPMARGYVIGSPDEIMEFEGDIVLKSQVLTGGRGKAGGIKKAGTIEEAREKASNLLSLKIKGHSVKKLFIQPAKQLLREYYLGYTVDRAEKKTVLIASAEGGMEIESQDESKLVKLYIDPVAGFERDKIEAVFEERFKDQSEEILELAEKLYRAFVKYDATTAEINPLALTEDGVMGVDSKLVLDDNSLFRHQEITGGEEDEEKSPLEREAENIGVSYVELEGDIGVIGCGAGLVMASLDALREYGGAAANFLDVGGGASRELMEKSIALVMKNPKVKSIFINMFAGITRCDEAAQAIVEKAGGTPVSVRMMGTCEVEGKRLLDSAGFDVFDSMEGAAKDAVEKAR